MHDIRIPSHDLQVLSLFYGRAGCGSDALRGASEGVGEGERGEDGAGAEAVLD